MNELQAREQGFSGRRLEAAMYTLTFRLKSLVWDNGHHPKVLGASPSGRAGCPRVFGRLPYP